MKFDRARVKVGMPVQSNRGEALGKIISFDDQAFIVEKGAFFPKDYRLRYEFITDIRGEQIVYALEDARASWEDDTPIGTKASSGSSTLAEKAKAIPAAAAGAVSAVGSRIAAATGSERAERAERRLDGEQEVHIPLRQEEMSVETVTRETGHVRIHKAVKTEEKHVTVPVTREEVVVERIALGDSTAAGLDGAFEEQTIDLTLHEQEVRVTKRPVVKEELRVRKISHEEQREAVATLRHEEAEIEDTTPPERRVREGLSGLMASGERELGKRR